MRIFTNPTLMNSPRWRGMRVGLLGGSFNPPHEGHLHISKAAMQMLGLDCIWWLVTPQNPLKSQKPLSMEQREALCNDLVDDPKILISTIEKDLGTNITYQTIKRLKTYYRDTDFVWITGMDNALSLHEWNNWQELLDLLPMAHLTRMPATSLVQNNPLRMYRKQRHIVQRHAGRPNLDSGQTFWILGKKMIDISSTEIRSRSKR